MDRLLSQSDVSGWHNTIERYTPDGALGRFLFTVAGLGLGSFLFFAGIVQVIGPTSAFLLSELVGLLSIPVGAGLLVSSLVVLWPVYISLTGNLKSASDYESIEEPYHETVNTPFEADGKRDQADSIKVLKQQYSRGEISHEEFEQKLQSILDPHVIREARTRRKARSNQNVPNTNTESELD